MKARKIIAPAVCSAVILTVGYLLQALLVPKYISEAREGNLIAEYYSSPKNHDVIFVGDCEIYENIDPVALYDGYGISSYLRGICFQRPRPEIRRTAERGIQPAGF